jgi:hypothetical protein
MADVVWQGGTSTDAGTAANWVSGSLPGSGDVAVFRTGSTRDCVWDASAIASLQGLKIEDDFNKTLTFGASGTLNLTSAGLIIEKAETIFASAAFTFAFSGALPFTGNIESYVKIDSTNDTTLDTSDLGMFGSSNSRTNMTFTFAIPTGVDVIMDDGVYPNLTLNAASGTCFFAMIYGAPFNTYGLVDILNFNAGNNVEIRKAATTYFPVANDYQKAFKFGGSLTISTDYFYAYRSTVTFVPQSAATYRFPADGETNFGGGANFYAQHYDVVIAEGDAAGTQCILDTGHILSCNSITVLEGGVLVGPGEHPGSEIRSVRRPVIDGTWNFVQVADGIYSSNDSTPFFGVPQGGTGLTTTLKNGLLMGNDMNALLTDANLTFINSILHADEGLKISEVADAPDHVAGTGILWVHNDAPSNLYFTDDAGNDIALTNNGAVIGGGITALTGNVTASGSGSVAATIADEAVTYAKMQHVSATSRVLGRITSGAGDVEELTGANIRTIANVADGATAYTDNLAAAASLTVGLAQITLSSDISGFTSGSYTKVNLDNSVVDTASAWDNTNKYYTIPAAGKWQVTYQCAMNGMTSSLSTIIAAAIFIDGGGGSFNLASRGSYAHISGDGSGGSVLFDASSGWKIALYLYHNGGSGKILLGDATVPFVTYLNIRQVGA